MATDSMTGAIALAFAADTALATRFAADGKPGCWDGEAPEDKPLPFVVVKVEGGNTDWDSGGYGVETSDVAFEVLAETDAASQQGAAAVQTAFDAVPSVISFATYRMMAFMRTSPKVAQPVEVRDRQGEVVYLTRVTYRAMVQIQR